MKAARKLLSAAAITLALAAGASAQPAAADAKNWPSHAIHLIVPFPAGSSPDLIARVLSEKLAPALGQPVVVDPRLGVDSVKEFVAFAKSQPGKLNYGSVGNGSTSHLTMELFKEAAGLELVHVPYPGSPQVNTAILSGQVAAGFVVPATAMPLVHSGRLKALAVTTSVRSIVLPEYPTLAEAGYPEVVSTAWNGIVAPAKTPRPIIERLSRELVAILRSEDVREKMLRMYFQPTGTAPAGLANLMRSEVERWGKVIRKTGATAD